MQRCLGHCKSNISDIVIHSMGTSLSKICDCNKKSYSIQKSYVHIQDIKINISALNILRLTPISLDEVLEILQAIPPSLT